MKRHLPVRKRADEAYRKNAEKMRLKHKVKQFAVGQYVSLHLPCIDRASTDSQRLPCVVVQVVGKNQVMYRLHCKLGVLKVCYDAGDLEEYCGSYGIPVAGWEEATRITLREAAKQSAPCNIFTGNKCSCSGACDTRRCPCKKKGIDCSSFCHKGGDCKNKKYSTPVVKQFSSSTLLQPSTSSDSTILSTQSASSSAPATLPPTSSPMLSSTPPTLQVDSSTSTSLKTSNTVSTNCPKLHLPAQSPTSALVSSSSTDHTHKSLLQKPCNCRTRCNSNKRCVCKAAGLTCLKTCHPGRSCSNNSVRCTITDLTKLDEPSEQQNSNDKWLTCDGITLHMKQLRILHSHSAWLDDQIIVAAQSTLKQRHSLFGGFQSPILGPTLAMSPPDREFVQVIIVDQNHWFALSTYNSLGGRLPKHCLKLVADLMQSREKSVIVEFVDVQEQKGANDCGLFALAYITSICNGQDPATLLYDQAAMRPHLQECFEKGEIHVTPFPASIGRVHQQPIIKVILIYCVCRLIDDGTKMIECTQCNEWYHMACVDIHTKYITNQKLDWFCQSCH